MNTTPSTLSDVVDAWTESTIICALLHYGLSAADGSHCVDALRKLGRDKAADGLAAALSEREAAPPVYDGLRRLR